MVSRSRTGSSAEIPPRRPTLDGAGVAIVAALLGLGVTGAVVVLGWIVDGGGRGSASDVTRVVGILWLLAHHGDILTSEGTVGAMPLGLAALPFGAVYATARRTLRATSRDQLSWHDRAAFGAGVTVTYLGCGTIVAVTTASGNGLRSSPLSGIFGVATVAGLAGIAAVMTGLPPRDGARLRGAVPQLIRSALVAGMASAVALCGAGALLVAGSLVAHFDRSVELGQSFGTGIVGGGLLALLGVLAVPNAVAWGASVVIGPGFSVGAGTTVGFAGVTIGAVPAFPLFAGLPNSGSGIGSVAAAAAIALPIAGGCWGGMVLLRRLPEEPPEWLALAGFGAGIVTGTTWVIMTALAGGPLGSGRLATVGASPWKVGVLSCLEVGLGAALTAWCGARLRQRRVAK
jgi:hypothetical protein